MISKLRVKHLSLDIPYNEAVVLLKAAAQTHGFEITESLDLDAFIRRHTGTGPNLRISLVQMQKPAMMMGGVLLGNTLALLLPLRIILWETERDTTVLHFPYWDVARDPDNTQAQHCMDIIYTEAVGSIAESLRQTQQNGLHSKEAPRKQTSRLPSDDSQLNREETFLNDVQSH